MFGQLRLLDNELTKENIEKYVSSYEILRYYCGNFEVNKRIHSPLRKDNNPSFAIQNYAGAFLWKDFATGESGNCYTIVMKKFHCDFIGALQRINIDFNLELNSLTGKTVERTPFIPKVEVKKECIIRIKSRAWRKEDLEYWQSFGINQELLERYKVKSIEHFWINDNGYSIGNQLAFSYEFPDGYKIYFPERKEYKWFTNSRYIQGLQQLDKTRDILIITKSLKDVICLESLGYSSIAPQAESVLLKSEDMNKAKKIFKKIYTLFDYDNAGIHLAWQMRKLYGTEPLFLTEGLWKRKQGYLGCKDISELIKKIGINEINKKTKKLNL